MRTRVVLVTVSFHWAYLFLIDIKGFAGEEESPETTFNPEMKKPGCNRGRALYSLISILAGLGILSAKRSDLCVVGKIRRYLLIARLSNAGGRFSTMSISLWGVH